MGAKTRKQDIIAGVLCLFVIAIFVYGMSNWQKYNVTNDGKVLGNLYYLSIATCFMMTGLIVRISARTIFYKLCGCALYSVFYVNLYIELARDPTKWNIIDGLFQVPVLFGIVAFEILLYVIDKNKKTDE